MLEARGIAVARGGVMVLAGVNFTLNAGQALILRGANGSGKTTLLRAIAGLQPLARGQLIGGDETIAYAAHADGVKPTLTVAENLAFWARIYRSNLAEAAMAAMNLTQLRARRAGHLSAGQKRRLGLARIMVTARPIWVFDEPTISLDNQAVAQFAAMVRAHLAQGGAALIATHIDLGFQAATLDVTPYRAAHAGPSQCDPFDEALT